MPQEQQTQPSVYLPHITEEPIASSAATLSDQLPKSCDTHVDMLEKGRKELIHQSRDYKLPLTVKAVADSYIEIAKTMAVVTALFAAVQISMAQVVFPGLSTSPWYQVLRWLIYAGIYMNAGATASALAFINYASYLTTSTRVLLLTDVNSMPYRVFYGETIPFKYLCLPYINEDFQLMTEFGLKKNMRPMWQALSYGFYAGSTFLFASMGVWVWLNETLVVAVSLTVLILPPAGWLTSSFFFTAEHVPSVPIDLAKNLGFCACTVLRCRWDE